MRSISELRSSTVAEMRVGCRLCLRCIRGPVPLEIGVETRHNWLRRVRGLVDHYGQDDTPEGHAFCGGHMCPASSFRHALQELLGKPHYPWQGAESFVDPAPQPPGRLPIFGPKGIVFATPKHEPCGLKNGKESRGGGAVSNLLEESLDP